MGLDIVLIVVLFSGLELFLDLSDGAGTMRNEIGVCPFRSEGKTSRRWVLETQAEVATLERSIAVAQKQSAVRRIGKGDLFTRLHTNVEHNRKFSCTCAFPNAAHQAETACR